MTDGNERVAQSRDEGVVLAEADSPLVRRQRCSDCAFTPGTEAHNSELTRLKVDLCVRLGRYFHCHRDALDTGRVKEPEALCAGWLQAVEGKIHGGGLVEDAAERAELELQLKCIEHAEAAHGGPPCEEFTDEELLILERRMDEWFKDNPTQPTISQVG